MNHYLRFDAAMDGTHNLPVTKLDIAGAAMTIAVEVP